MAISAGVHEAKVRAWEEREEVAFYLYGAAVDRLREIEGAHERAAVGTERERELADEVALARASKEYAREGLDRIRRRLRVVRAGPPPRPDAGGLHRRR